ncbi:MAG: RNA-directed DNA polymerase, partial [Desulfobacteraceae bacterium]|nr:RNA-directed DNA polymerase [Desulfobacteraceae bacterium]
MMTLAPMIAEALDRPPVEEGKLFSPKGKAMLKALDQEFKGVWAKDQFDVGLVKAYPFSIRIQEDEEKSPPHNIRSPYRVKPEIMDNCRQQLEDMVSRGIIERAPGDWASGILFVPKKNGEQRMCVDYRELNRRTMKEDWPTPRIDDSISRLATQRYLSCFDLRGGYLHIPVLETSRKYTRFTTPYGAYQAKRMLFGLVNAPAHFQETMERIFAEVRKMEGVVLEIYIDDLVLGTVTEE